MSFWAGIICPWYDMLTDIDPSWMTEKMKNKMIQKKLIYKPQISCGKIVTDYQKLNNIRNGILQIISKRKKEYYNHLSQKT